MFQWLKRLCGRPSAAPDGFPAKVLTPPRPGETGRGGHASGPSDTPFIVALTDGQLIRAARLQATALGIEIGTAGGVNAVVSPRNIQRLFREGPAQSVALEAVAYEKSAIALGLVEVEHLLLHYLASEKTPDRASLRREIVVFGSSSLALSILPTRTSHDIDMAVADRFVSYANERLPYSRNPKHIDLEFCPRWLLRHCGEWEERCSLLVGESGVQFKVVHPLDTVSQKLLRIPEAVFEAKDKEDIRQIVSILNPDRESVIRLLREGSSRFHLLERSVSDAVRRNTRWFLDEFSFKIDLEADVIEAVRLSETHELERLHLRPVVPEQRWADIVPNEPPGLRARRDGR